MTRPTQRAPHHIACILAIKREQPRAETKVQQLRRFVDDPYGFACEVFGLDVWDGQREILEAVRDHGFVAVCSGHKIGKSTGLAIIAWWFFCMFPKARVIITAKTERQVKGIIWKEIRWLAKLAARRGYNLPGANDMPLDPSTGIHDPEDFSEIFGFTAREIEAVAGVSAPHMLWLVDEASGIDDRIFEAIFGNMMGGAKIVLISNPTRGEGEFFRAFNDAGSQYHTLQISSLRTPNCTGVGKSIPGLADPDMIEKMRIKWGEDSPQFKVRVLGQFVVEEEGKLFSHGLVAECMAAWEEGRNEEVQGQLVVSLDPAGDSGEGDESCFGVRRGNRLLELHAHRGLDVDGHERFIRGLIELHKRRSDGLPVVIVDRDGSIGYKVWKHLRNALDGEARVIGVRAGNKAPRRPDVYETVRDEMAGNIKDRAKSGELELIGDVKLTQELTAPSLTMTTKGRLRLTPKKELKVALGRSPDRYDCVCLAFWWIDLGVRTGDPLGTSAPTTPTVTSIHAEHDASTASSDAYETPFDPYGLRIAA